MEPRSGPSLSEDLNDQGPAPSTFPALDLDLCDMAGIPCNTRGEVDFVFCELDPQKSREIVAKVASAKRAGKKRKSAVTPHKEIHLRIAVILRKHGMVERTAIMLIDTGAEVCLIKEGLLPPEVFVDSPRPMRLLAANNQCLSGGTREVVVSVCLKGVIRESNQPMELEVPTRLYEAGIGEDILLSYTWLVSRNMDVLSMQHGLCAHHSSQNIFVPGISGVANPLVAGICGKPFVRVSEISRANLLCALDLCSGTGSATRVLQDHGYEVISVDVDAKWGSTKVIDVLDWDYSEEFSPGYFDIVVAAPWL